MLCSSLTLKTFGCKKLTISFMDDTIHTQILEVDQFVLLGNLFPKLAELTLIDFDFCLTVQVCLLLCF